MKEFTLSEEQLTKLLNASKPVPLVMLQYGMPRSPQENANKVWKEFSEEMGFKMLSVRPNGNDPRKFFAEIKEG